MSISTITYDGNVLRREIVRLPSCISAKSSVATRIWPNLSSRPAEWIAFSRLLFTLFS